MKMFHITGTTNGVKATFVNGKVVEGAVQAETQLFPYHLKPGEQIDSSPTKKIPKDHGFRKRIWRAEKLLTESDFQVNRM